MMTTHNNATAEKLAANHPPAPQSQWDRWAERARAMTDSELFYAIADCVETNRVFEASGMCGGKYRDEASVYRAEQRRRRNK